MNAIYTFSVLMIDAKEKKDENFHIQYIYPNEDLEWTEDPD